MSQHHSSYDDLVLKSRDAFPGPAYAPESLSHQPANEDTQPDAVNSVQHAIRTAVSAKGVSGAEQMVRQFGEYEADVLLPDVDELKTEFDSADQYISTTVESDLNSIQNKLQERRAWYDKLLRGEWGVSIEDIQSKAETLSRNQSELILVVISESPAIETPDWVDTTLTPDDIHRSPEAFGYELPHAFLAVENGRKDNSIYPLVPWYGTVVCTCHAKQNMSFMPCCKHELFAANRTSDATYTPPKQLPERYRRIVSPTGNRLYADIVEYYQSK